MSSIFTELIENDTGNFVYKDSLCVAMLDINPAAEGHCLVIPRQEVDQWTDLNSGLVAHLMKVAQLIGKAQIELFKCQRSGLMIAGFEVAHCHLHVIPINSMADFELGLLDVEREELAAVQKKLVEVIESL